MQIERASSKYFMQGLFGDDDEEDDAVLLGPPEEGPREHEQVREREKEKAMLGMKMGNTSNAVKQVGKGVERGGVEVQLGRWNEVGTGGGGGKIGRKL